MAELDSRIKLLLSGIKQYTEATYLKSTDAADTYIKVDLKGVANGVATLDETGLVPSSQLPSYVDDVIEVDSSAALPERGESGKIYVTLDDNLTYRWSGTQYVEISKSLALGETSSTAYAGDKGKKNADDIADLSTRLKWTDASVLDLSTHRVSAIETWVVTADTSISNLSTGLTDLRRDASNWVKDLNSSTNTALDTLRTDASNWVKDLSTKISNGFVEEVGSELLDKFDGSVFARTTNRKWVHVYSAEEIDRADAVVVSKFLVVDTSIADLYDKIKDAADDVDSKIADASKYVNGRVNDLSTFTLEASTYVNGRVTAAETRITTAENDIDALEERVDKSDASINAIENQLATEPYVKDTPATLADDGSAYVRMHGAWVRSYTKEEIDAADEVVVETLDSLTTDVSQLKADLDDVSTAAYSAFNAIEGITSAAVYAYLTGTTAE